jgi:hypothetical protein
MATKKRSTKQFEETSFEETDHEGKVIPVADPDEYEFLFYHSPDFKYLYIAVLGEKTTPATVAGIFTKAVNVSQKEFDRLFRLHPDATVITIADDYFIDNKLPELDDDKQA